MKTALYRHWSAEDELLYIGISLQPLARLKQHKRTRSEARTRGLSLFPQT